MVVAVSLVVVGPDRPRPTTLLPSRSNGKPEAATAVYKLLMMGKKMPETCWAVFERRTINMRDWCICLVDLFEWNFITLMSKTKQYYIIFVSYCCNMVWPFFRPYSSQRTYVYCEHWNTTGCQARSINLHKNLRTKVMLCCANSYFNRRYLTVHSTHWLYFYIRTLAWRWSKTDQNMLSQ